MVVKGGVRNPKPASGLDPHSLAEYVEAELRRRDEVLASASANFRTAVQPLLATLRQELGALGESPDRDWTFLDAAFESTVDAILATLPRREPDDGERVARSAALWLLKAASDFRLVHFQPEKYSIDGKIDPYEDEKRSKATRANILVHASADKVSDLQVAFLRDIDWVARRATVGWGPPTRAMAEVILTLFGSFHPPGGHPAELPDAGDESNQELVVELLEAWTRRGRPPSGKSGKYLLANTILEGFGIAAESAQALEHTWQTRDRRLDRHVESREHFEKRRAASSRKRRETHGENTQDHE